MAQVSHETTSEQNVERHGIMTPRTSLIIHVITEIKAEILSIIPKYVVTGWYLRMITTLHCY